MIDRYVRYGCKENLTIYTFCDANNKAYETAVFLRRNDKVSV